MDRRWWDELTCILCLAIGTMCLMNGYDTQSFIVEPVLHSVHMREPGTIAKHAGYYGSDRYAQTLSSLAVAELTHQGSEAKRITHG
ncbi:hypothetical protein TELCIR_05444 [Teladorsagia circumcincta]|uniref:Uncharacterized protein n=1 Tax=Teladorsagia circumcincta TaxID=45464 RepID=A0A2G9USD2_TELCI|nr:hypothetical protein TELCIR_05444 [Teladorsagia circumcincta]